MRKLVLAPFALLVLLLVLFALSNRQSVQIGLWPTDFALRAPLALIILAALGGGVLLGALLLWLGTLGGRLRANRTAAALARVEAELRALRERAPGPAGPGLPAPPAP